MASESQVYTLLIPSMEMQRLVFAGDKDEPGPNPPQLLLHLWNCNAFPNLAKNALDIDFHHILGVSDPQDWFSRLKSLPPEVRDMIFELLSDHDSTGLGLCSRTLFGDFLHHVRKHQRAPWSKQPIICTGTWLTSLPETVIDRYPEYQVARKKESDDQNKNPFRIRRRKRTAREWNTRMWRDDCWIMEGDCNNQFWVRSIREHLKPKRATPGSLWPGRRYIYALIDRALGKHEDFSGKWILKNLDAKLYIRLVAKYVTGWKGLYVALDGFLSCPLDNVLLFKITWAGMVDFEGPWAGHRFEIVREHDTRMLDQGGWIDYTSILADEYTQVMSLNWLDETPATQE